MCRPGASSSRSPGRKVSPSKGAMKVKRGKGVAMKQKFNRLDCSNRFEDLIGWILSPVAWAFLCVLSPFLFIAKIVTDKVLFFLVGRNVIYLEFIPVDVLKAKFKKIYVVDISPSLLDVARSRVEKVGLSDIVECVCCDFTDSESVRKHLPKKGSVDIVTFSYSLSMIPNKKGALESAMSLLKDGGDGYLGIADFFEKCGREHLLQYPIQLLKWLEAKAHKYYFRCDGVHLLTDEVVNEGVGSDAVKEFDERFRGSVPLLPILRPIQGFTFYTKGLKR